MGCLSVLDIKDCAILLQSDVIVWPNPNQKAAAKAFYNDNHGIPGLIGMIDGTHISIVNYATKEQKNDLGSVQIATVDLHTTLEKSESQFLVSLQLQPLHWKLNYHVMVI